MLPLVLKLTLAPGLVATATLVARRLGPRVGGLLAGTPIVAGPILLVVLLEQGHAFGDEAARGALLGMLPTLAFCLAYAAASARHGAAPTLGAAVAAYAGTFAALALLGDVPLGVAIGVALACTLATAALVRSLADAPPRTGARGDLLLARVAITAVLLLVVTRVAGGVSPHVAGLLVPFPIITAVLSTFTHVRAGTEAVVALLGGLTRSLVSFWAFFVVLAVLLPHVPTGVAFLLAAAATGVAMAVLLLSPAPRAATSTG